MKFFNQINFFRFSLIESGQKLLYLNTSMRGYPKGLRAGSDPRKPVISVDEHFENVDCRGITSVLMSIEVKRDMLLGIVAIQIFDIFDH